MKHFNHSTTGHRRHLSPSGRALQLFIWLIVVITMPNLILAFTEDYNGWSAVAGVILPLGLYLLTTIFTRRVSLIALFLSPVLALCIVQIVLLYLYGNSIIAVDMFTNIMTTNSGESSELLGGLTPITIVVALLYVPLLYAILRQAPDRRYCISERVRGRSVMVGAIMVIVGVQLLYPAGHYAGRNVVSAEIFPANAIHNFVIALRNRRAVDNYARTSAHFRYDAEHSPKTSKREIYLYVIGESSRAANWNLYGYFRTTNPRLGSRDDIYLFKNVITQSNTTHKSVPLMLSSADAEEYDELFKRKGLAALFKEVGFRTYFISTQSPQGAMVDNFANECDEVIYIGEPNRDMQLLPAVQQIIASDNSDKMLFVLHCYGSHYCYNQRYTPESVLFTPDDETEVHSRNIEALRNAYDNSIIYTDRMLDSFADYLGTLDACTAMLYCSDHGEGLFDDERGLFLHASPVVTYYQLHVPCVAWFSEEYCRCHPEKIKMAQRHRWSPTTTSSLFHTVADMASIRSRYVDSRRSLVSPAYDEQAPRLYLTDKNEAVRLDHRIGISELDRREFLLHGIHLD